MTGFNVDFDNVQEPQPVDPGMYNVQITGATLQESKSSGRPMIKATIGNTDFPDAPVFNHYISLPSEGDEKNDFKTLMLKRFLVLFKMNVSGGDIDYEELAVEMVGATAKVEIGKEVSQDGAGVFNKLIVPRLKN